MTVSISDMTVPESKPQADRGSTGYCGPHCEELQRRSYHTEEERYKEVIETWKTTDDQLTHDLA